MPLLPAAVPGLQPPARLCWPGFRCQGGRAPAAGRSLCGARDGVAGTAGRLCRCSELPRDAPSAHLLRRVGHGRGRPTANARGVLRPHVVEPHKLIRERIIGKLRSLPRSRDAARCVQNSYMCSALRRCLHLCSLRFHLLLFTPANAQIPYACMHLLLLPPPYCTADAAELEPQW